MLNSITPVLLTYNEGQNIARTLSRLKWAKDIVVVDSGSTDETLSILEKVPNVRVFKRAFDTHAKQWQFAVEETKISTDWILRLDADYYLTDALIEELTQLDPGAAVNGYRVQFEYAIFSHRLLASLYPPNTILLRKGCFSVRDRGHTEEWDVIGPVATLRSRIVHDDRKLAAQWIPAQARYMQRELAWMQENRSGLRYWLRTKPPLMPLAVFFYCLFMKGLILNGRAGIFYSLQRMVAEATLSLMVLEQKLRDESANRRDSKQS